MAYTGSGQLIEATDFNGLASTNVYTSSTNVGGNVAWVWGTGYGNTGYGQSTTLLASVSSAAIITATQWAGLIYTTNKALAHQNAATIGGGPLGANINVVSGAIITYFSNVASAVTLVNNLPGKLGYYAQGTTVTGSNFNSSFTAAGSTSAASFSTTRTLTFASGGDAARYFFNAGGRVTLVITATNNVATARSQDFAQMFQSNIGSSYFQANFSVGKTGSGGTVNTNATNLGYYSLTTSYQTLANITPLTQAYLYNNDWVRVQVVSNGVQGSAGDTGSALTFRLNAASPAQAGSDFNDGINITVTTRIDVTPPETTYLANTWGVFGVT
jgi:hypothetical protein